MSVLAGKLISEELLCKIKVFGDGMLTWETSSTWQKSKAEREREDTTYSRVSWDLHRGCKLVDTQLGSTTNKVGIWTLLARDSSYLFEVQLTNSRAQRQGRYKKIGHL